MDWLDYFVWDVGIAQTPETDFCPTLCLLISHRQLKISDCGNISTTEVCHGTNQGFLQSLTLHVPRGLVYLHMLELGDN